MKLSLAWIFDHIESDWKLHDVEHIVAQFNKTTAEIESFSRISFDLKNFFVGSACKSGFSDTLCGLPELNAQVVLSKRIDVLDGQFYLIKKEGDVVRWATLADFGVEKDGLIPALDIDSEQAQGLWRDVFEKDDIILEVDNKSITHRPDMWGHRGFAREIAAFLNLPLRMQESMVKVGRLFPFQARSEQTQHTPFIIDNQAKRTCSRFTGFFIKSICNKPSSLLVTSRLLKVGSRPINALVDLTNYVMHDWGQPVHAYDADTIEGKRVVIRMARAGETLDVLDGAHIELTADDMVVADAEKPICLAGVMGGKNSAVGPNTTSIFFEAATFDAGVVRRTAQRHKIRTESSARFEKTLDPMQAAQATQRFIALLAASGIEAHYDDEIIVVGADVSPTTIEVTHDFLEQRAGIAFSQAEIVDILSRLEFHVLKTINEAKQVVYIITVPSFRASKDIAIKEDILEEVVRSYGFDRIMTHLPLVSRTPFDMKPVMRERAIKMYLAHGLGMTEQQNYSLFDEQYLRQIDYAPPVAVTLLNPVSENHARMITSLLPGLFKNVSENHIHTDQLAFFEYARVWRMIDGEPCEQKSIAGIFFKKRSSLDFYIYKTHVMHFFNMLGLRSDAFTWHKIEQPSDPWLMSYQSAHITYQNKVVATVGVVDDRFVSKLGVDTSCSAFTFEIDGDFAIMHSVQTASYKTLSKFQETYFDLSLLVPYAVESATLERALARAHEHIMSVHIIDFFEKRDDASGMRAITFRVWLQHPDKTLEKSEIDAIWRLATTVMQSCGATVRM